MQATLVTVLLGCLLLAPTFASIAAARPPTITEKYDLEQRKERRSAERESDAYERELSLRVKLKKARQTRRTLVKKGEDTLDIDEDIERLKRETGDDDD